MYQSGTCWHAAVEAAVAPAAAAHYGAEKEEPDGMIDTADGIEGRFYLPQALSLSSLWPKDTTTSISSPLV